MAHAKALRSASPSERLSLLKAWGGSTIAYRRRMIDSPSYTLNHEEVEKALEEGIASPRGSRRRASRSTSTGMQRQWNFRLQKKPRWFCRRGRS